MVPHVRTAAPSGATNQTYTCPAMPPPRAAVVAEFYPRAYDTVLGIWAHRQALATRDAGAEVTVFVLHRLVPPAAGFNPRELANRLRQPRFVELDGLPIHYVRYVSPARGRTYARWGAWAAPALRRALRRAGPFDVVHAHNAVPSADAVLRAGAKVPLVVSVHGGDVLWTARNHVPGGRSAVARALTAADLVLANSAGIAELATELGARPTEVVHLGSDLPAPAPRSPQPLLVTVGHLVARKRHADVIRALTRLPSEVRYLVIGEGPEREALARLAGELGLADRVELAGQLEPRVALGRARQAWLFVMPSSEEAFGVAYVEAMAAGVPAIGTRAEPGPAEIAACGGGIELVAPGDPAALAQTIEALLSDRDRLGALSAAARETVAESFSWQRCGERTVAVYGEVLGG
jgi:teichuronic acid biosynthesis glycosyltransferase TuaC